MLLRHLADAADQDDDEINDPEYDFLNDEIAKDADDDAVNARLTKIPRKTKFLFDWSILWYSRSVPSLF